MKKILTALLLVATAHAGKPKPKPPAADPGTLHSPWDVSPVALTQGSLSLPSGLPYLTQHHDH